MGKYTIKVQASSRKEALRWWKGARSDYDQMQKMSKPTKDGVYTIHVKSNWKKIRKA